MPTEIGYLVVEGASALPFPSLVLTERTTAFARWPQGPPRFRGQEWLKMIGTNDASILEKPSLVLVTRGEVERRPTDPEGLMEAELHWCYVALALATGHSNDYGVRAVHVRQPEHEDTITHFSGMEMWSAREGTPTGTNYELWPKLCRRLTGLTGQTWQDNAQVLHSLRSFWRATQANWVDDRFELFCRSAETMLWLGRGEGADAFARGLLALLGREPTVRRRRSFERLYQRRNDIVHGNRFLDKGKDARAAGLVERVARRSLQIVLAVDDIFDATANRHADLRKRRTTK